MSAMQEALTVTRQQMLIGLVRRIEGGAAASEMIERLRAEMPTYRQMPDTVVQIAVSEMTRRNLEAFVRSVVEGRPPSEDELTAFGRSAQERASEGFPLEDLVHAYRVGGRMLYQTMCDLATPEERDALPLAADRVMSYIDLVSAVVTRRYLAHTASHTSESERHLRDLLGALASGEPLLPVDLEVADRVGFPLCDSYRPFVAVISGGPRRAHAQMAAHLRVAGLLALTEADRVIGLAPPDASPPPMAPPARMILGEPVERAHLAEALDELRLLSAVAELDGHSRPATIDEYLPELLLARSPRAARLRRRIVEPLHEQGDRRGTDLVNTLETLLACRLDRRRAAAALHVHHNTLDYRVRRAEEIAGLDLSSPRDLVALWLALQPQELAPANGGVSLRSAG